MDTQHIEAINHRKGRSGRVYGENSRDMAEPYSPDQNESRAQF